MLLLLHIGIAFIGLLFTAFTYAYPNQYRIRISLGFLAATVISGSALVVVAQASFVRACMSGLLVSAVMYLGIYAAQKRLKFLSAN